MLKWRRVSAGGCWEISLTMRWLRRTRTLTRTRASSPVEALFPSLPQFSHIIWIHLNVVWLKPISLHQKRLRWMEDLTVTTSTGARISAGPLWKVCCRLHMLPINMLPFLMVTQYICDEHTAETGVLNVPCSLIWGVQVAGMALVRMFAPTLNHSSQRALCVSHSCLTLNNYLYCMKWADVITSLISEAAWMFCSSFFKTWRTES